MLVTRDPFARQELHRVSVTTHQSCDWCGGRRANGKLWEYEIQPDGLSFRHQPIKGRFCSASCFRSYHN